MELDLRSGSRLPLLPLWAGAPHFASMWFRVDPGPRPDQFSSLIRVKGYYRLLQWKLL